MSQPKSDQLNSNSSNTNKALVKVTNLVKHFPKRGGVLNQVTVSYTHLTLPTIYSV